MSIDQSPPRYAVIDVGTNSVKFLLAERSDHGRWLSIVDRAELSRLGEGLGQSGVISDAAVERTVAAIESMVEEATRRHVIAIAAVGTAALRIAANRAQVLRAIHTRTGVRVDVISGEEEGRLAYVAARSGLALKSCSLVVFDTGGGSSQFSFGRDTGVDERFSVNIGAAGFTEQFKLDGAVSRDTLEAAMTAIATDLSALDNRPAPDVLVAMGGAVTNIAAVKHGLATYDPAIVQGTLLDAAEIDRQIELYRSRDAVARRAVTGVQPKRAEVILAGACIVRTVMDKLGARNVTVSNRGLRHGVLDERFG